MAAAGRDGSGTARESNSPGDPPFEARVRRAVKEVPEGRVASYGDIAAAAGRPRSARAVGRVLRNLPDDALVPWWRVVNARGEISIPASTHARPLQRALLEDEGVEFGENGRIDLRRFRW